jgi:hypothetical protein
MYAGIPMYAGMYFTQGSRAVADSHHRCRHRQHNCEWSTRWQGSLGPGQVSTELALGRHVSVKRNLRPSKLTKSRAGRMKRLTFITG